MPIWDTLCLFFSYQQEDRSADWPTIDAGMSNGNSEIVFKRKNCFLPNVSQTIFGPCRESITSQGVPGQTRSLFF